MDSTIDYYNKRAKEYYERTVGVDMSHLCEKFLNYIKDGGHILDLGCGSGRDSLYFIEQGYKVTPIDGSLEMVKFSSRLLGQKVLHMKFSELNFNKEFNGIWACASLLHVSKENIYSVIRKLLKALKEDGIIYISFKYGKGEEKIKERLFSYYTKGEIKKLIARFSRLEIVEVWRTADQEKRKKDWLNVLVRKKWSFLDRI